MIKNSYKMNPRHRSSRIINIALVSAGIETAPKCRQKLNFNLPIMQPAPDFGRNDAVLVENESSTEPSNNVGTYITLETAQTSDHTLSTETLDFDRNDALPIESDEVPLLNDNPIDKGHNESSIDPSNSMGTDITLETAQTSDHTLSTETLDFDRNDALPIESDEVPLLNDNPIDEGHNESSIDPSNSMGTDITLETTQTSLHTYSTETAHQSNNSNSHNKNRIRKCKINFKHIDYMSEEEDFSTFYGDIDDSDDWSKEQRESDEETDDLDSSGKKNKNFRRRKANKNSTDQEETIGNSGIKIKKVNDRKLRSTKKKAGELYATKKGDIVPAKKVLPNPCQGKRCGNDCGSIPEKRRESLFQHFWKLDSVRRRDWLVSISQKVCIKRKRTNTEKRNYTIKYFINEGEGKRNVCRQFLAATINVSDKTIYTIVNNAESGSAKEDMRGKSEPSNKTKQTTIDAAIDFIKRLPAVPSHYCRQDSSKLYLPEEFKNVANLYNIYRRRFVDQGFDVVSERVFRKIFDEKFNVGFHIPKKDKCKKCIMFEKTTDPAQLKDKQEHETEKHESYARFQSHKNIHKDDPATLCVSFDLQKVLNTPYSPSMLLYYSRKLAVYNLCFYENGTRQVFCYYWDESNGNRGANEISTLIHKYIKSVDARGTITRLLIYCDCCPGQNRNRTVMGMLHQTLQDCVNIKTIQLNFLLTGHTYMPVDSSHAVIENHLKQTTIFAPSQWYTVFATARKNPSPFNVERLSFEDFKKWDNIGDKYFKGNLTGKISKIRIATFKRDKPSVSVKFSMNSAATSSIVEVQPKTRVPLLSCYRSLLPISKKKYDDLHKLCVELIIPAFFHNEYTNIPRDANAKDVLPESDIEDPDFN